MMSEQTDNVELKGRISAVSVLDLRRMKSMEELSNITAIEAVGTILLSDSFQGLIASIPMKAVGSIISLPEGSKVNQIGGTLKVGGEFLENGSVDGSDILLVTGELILTSPPKKFGYKQLIVVGQLFIPRGSESILTPCITQSSGEIIPYDHHNSRFFMGQGQFGREFFECLKKPVVMMLNGTFTIESDVSKDLLLEKVTEIVLSGTLMADKKLVPILTALAVEQLGGSILDSSIFDDVTAYG
ncbi:hypothetical protein [Paenibacillus herberti]|uniref:Uncharacterized protein n=1 Tax=Paenibacillus herberti TaxID=1619309 RepID=A0A229P307_9BACL|nr:hypothetical protein [Paenibacillus herberti]OXM16334.1 hypothetical protein CGZ75_06520 [Paenibacillus herberti]